MTTTQPPAVRAYLDELRGLLAGSPDRDLVVDGVARHIEDALADGPADAGRVRSVLVELGDPAVIAAEAAPAPPQPVMQTPFLERRGGAILIVLLLAIGGLVVPVLGWVVGLGLLWFSKGWRVVDKLVGSLAIPVGLALAVGVGGLLTNASHLVVLVAFPILDLAVAVYLLRRFRATA